MGWKALTGHLFRLAKVSGMLDQFARGSSPRKRSSFRVKRNGAVREERLRLSDFHTPARLRNYLKTETV